jgi:hypothetical protein
VFESPSRTRTASAPGQGSPPLSISYVDPASPADEAQSDRVMLSGVRLSLQAVQPSQAAPAFIPPNQNVAAMSGRGTTHSGLRRIQWQPSPNRISQTLMKIATAHPGAIKPDAKKNGASASIAARANPATTYLATVRASCGMDASFHFGAALSGDKRATAGPADQPDAQPDLGGDDYCQRDPIQGSEREDNEAE